MSIAFYDLTLEDQTKSQLVTRIIHEDIPTIKDDNETTIDTEKDDSWLQIYIPIKRYEESMVPETGIGKSIQENN